MAVTLQFIEDLRAYAAESDENKADLIAKKAVLFAAIFAGQSGVMVSSSMNGVTASQMGGMTNQELYSAISRALKYLDAGLTPSSRTIARII